MFPVVPFATLLPVAENRLPPIPPTGRFGTTVSVCALALPKPTSKAAAEPQSFRHRSVQCSGQCVKFLDKLRNGKNGPSGSLSSMRNDLPGQVSSHDLGSRPRYPFVPVATPAAAA